MRCIIETQVCTSANCLLPDDRHTEDSQSKAISEETDRANVTPHVSKLKPQRVLKQMKVSRFSVKAAGSPGFVSLSMELSRHSG
jgi:hypothetical protein